MAPVCPSRNRFDPDDVKQRYVDELERIQKMIQEWGAGEGGEGISPQKAPAEGEWKESGGFRYRVKKP